MRLIDADELLNQTANLEAVALEQVDKYNPSDNPLDLTVWMVVLAERTAFKDNLMDTPIVDAVPVVRCKDCEFYTEEERWCRRLGLCGAFNENDYCSRGERREDETY